MVLIMHIGYHQGGTVIPSSDTTGVVPCRTAGGIRLYTARGKWNRYTVCTSGNTSDDKQGDEKRLQEEERR